MYVLTEGWYGDRLIKGVTDSESQAHDWADSDMYRDYDGPHELGEVAA